MCLGIAKPHHHSRRQFLRQAAVGGSLVCTFGQGWQNLLAMAKPLQGGFDLLVKGGKVVTPPSKFPPSGTSLFATVKWRPSQRTSAKHKPGRCSMHEARLLRRV